MARYPAYPLTSLTPGATSTRVPDIEAAWQACCKHMARLSCFLAACAAAGFANTTLQLPCARAGRAFTTALTSCSMAEGLVSARGSSMAILLGADP